MNATLNVIKGRIKEAAGALTGKKKLREKGRAEQALGRTEQVAEKGVKKAKEVADDMVERAKDDAEKQVDKEKKRMA